MKKIESFTDLVAWKEGHALVLTIYQVTSSFPRSESYVLTDQMHRCVVSITSNIAEGFSRRGNKEKAQFYYTALGSTTELQNQLLIARDLGIKISIILHSKLLKYISYFLASLKVQNSSLLNT